MMTIRDFSFHFSCYTRKGGRGVSPRFYFLGFAVNEEN